MAYLRHQREVPGAGALLRYVHRRARVVVVSNNLYPDQMAKLRHLGVAGEVDALVTSDRVGVPKPDRRMFEAAIAEAGVPAGRCTMVGDSWATDIEGARGVGMAAVWLSNGAPLRARVDGVTQVPSLRPLAGIVPILFPVDHS